MAHRTLHFVTGRLAEPSLRRVLAELSPMADMECTVQVMPITVAALMTAEWIARRIEAPRGTERVILPGYCAGDLSLVERAAGVPVELGPRDLRRLPEYFGHQQMASDYGDFDIEILAEINHAPRLNLAAIVAQAAELRAAGADVIDVGCNPGETWSSVGDAVRALRGEGHRVSIDSLNVAEIEAATRAGAELVLSVNSSNRDAAADWGCEVVAIPDHAATLSGLDDTIEALASCGVPLRIDPIIEPIGFGFAASLGRFLDIRRRYPDAEMMMGVGNLTELTDADSAAINVLLLGFCQELGIRSILTTQVVSWARSAVRECDLARRLVYHAVSRRVLPKHVEPRLVMLRDPPAPERSEEELAEIAKSIRDGNYRLFAERGRLHAIAAGTLLSDRDPFALFDAMRSHAAKPIDAGHAFYLGYELCKAATAIALGKEYRQDESLDWGMLTVAEESHRARREKSGEKHDGGDLTSE